MDDQISIEGMLLSVPVKHRVVCECGAIYFLSTQVITRFPWLNEYTFVMRCGLCAQYYAIASTAITLIGPEHPEYNNSEDK